MDCVFFGTPAFSRIILERISARHRVCLAVTRPDRPAGRGRAVQVSPVKEFCRAAGIPCLDPVGAREPGLLAAVRESGAAIGVVVSYGGYLPESLLAALPGGFINLHPSLLPRYRGAAPVNWALIRGETVTGLTVIRVTARMDAGPILFQRKVFILPRETAGELLLRLAAPGADALLTVLDEMADGTVREREQDETLATLAPRLSKEDGRIDWQAPAAGIANLIWGTAPWPGAHTRHGAALVKVLAAEEAGESGGAPGTVLRADAGGLLVAAGEGALRLLTLQREGGKPLPWPEFLRGVRWRPGELLGP